MLPSFISQIPIKNVLCARAIGSMVMDKVVYETLDSSTMSSIFTSPSPSDVIYIGLTCYFIKLYISEYTPIRAKETKLHQYVLTPRVYRSLNISLFILFWIIKNPLNAI